MKYTSSILLPVIFGAVMIASLIVIKIVTRNLSKIRKNFYRSLGFFVVFPLYMFSTTFSNVQPPQPLEIPDKHSRFNRSSAAADCDEILY